MIHQCELPFFKYNRRNKAVIVQKITIAALICAAALLQPLLLTSCSSDTGTVKNAEAVNNTSKVKISQSYQTSQLTQPDFSANVVQQATFYKSSSGRVALSMLICRLDSSYVYSDLIKKSAKELFDIVSKTAVEKNVTLESLNSKYGLCDILASEKIYVSIESNNVTSLPQLSSSKAIGASASKKSDVSSSQTAAKSGSKLSSKVSKSGSGSNLSSNTGTWVDKFQKAILQTAVS
jgi:hypothetical protein